MDRVKAYYSMSQVARRTLNELRSYKPLTEALGEYAERNILAWDVLYCGRDGREWPMTGESTFREELLRHGHMRKKMPALNVVVVTDPKKTTGRVPPSC